jgi:hypothetical protein
MSFYDVLARTWSRIVGPRWVMRFKTVGRSRSSDRLAISLANGRLRFASGPIYSGKTEYEPIAAVSSIAYALSFLVFAVTAILALWARKV